MSEISQVAARMKLESPVMAATPVEVRNDALARIKDALLAHSDEIFAANAEDLAAAERDGVAPAIVKRLRFDEHKLADVTAGIDGLIGLPLRPRERCRRARSASWVRPVNIVDRVFSDF